MLRFFRDGRAPTGRTGRCISSCRFRRAAAPIGSRLLALPLQGLLGEPFVVENRSGAAGRIGTSYVAKADPDGGTLLVTTKSSIVIAPHSGVAMNYDPLKDLVPVSLLTRNTCCWWCIRP